MLIEYLPGHVILYVHQHTTLVSSVYQLLICWLKLVKLKFGILVLLNIADTLLRKKNLWF